MSGSGFEGSLLAGRWEVGSLVAWSCGDGGVLHEARDTKTGAAALAKIHATGWVPSARLEEKRLADRIAHPAFIRILDAGTDTGIGRGYEILERIDARPVADLLEGGPAELSEAVSIARQLLAALGAAHAQGFVLGRLAAGDVFVSPDASGPRARLEARFRGDASARATRASEEPWTPPELEGPLPALASPQSDLYLVGWLLYRMLSGEPPFDGRDALSLRDAKMSGKPAPLRVELGVPLSVQQALWRALEPDPENRWRSAADFEAALRI